MDYLKPVIITKPPDRDIQDFRLWGTIHKGGTPCRNVPSSVFSPRNKHRKFFQFTGWYRWCSDRDPFCRLAARVHRAWRVSHKLDQSRTMNRLLPALDKKWVGCGASQVEQDLVAGLCLCPHALPLPGLPQWLPGFAVRLYRVTPGTRHPQLPARASSSHCRAPLGHAPQSPSRQQALW